MCRWGHRWAKSSSFSMAWAAMSANAGRSVDLAGLSAALCISSRVSAEQSSAQHWYGIHWKSTECTCVDRVDRVESGEGRELKWREVEKCREGGNRRFFVFPLTPSLLPFTLTSTLTIEWLQLSVSLTDYYEITLSTLLCLFYILTTPTLPPPLV